MLRMVVLESKVKGQGGDMCCEISVSNSVSKWTLYRRITFSIFDMALLAKYNSPF